MTDGIGRIFGGNNYGVGGYVPQGKGNAPEEEVPQAPVNNYEDTQIDPDKVLDILAQNNKFVKLTRLSEPNPNIEPDPGIAERATVATELYIQIMEVLEDLFGDRAPDVMDVLMDKLLGLVE